MSKSLSLALYRATRGRPKSKGNSDKLPPRPDGPLVWFHTGQDPVALAVRELCSRLRAEREDLQFLLTSSLEMNVKSDVYMVPGENGPAIREFLDHWRPDVSIWTEPDLRLALVSEADQRDIPLILADARTMRHTQTTRWWPRLSRAVLSPFGHVLTGDAATANALRRLGANPETIEIKGFLEEGSPALPCNESDRSALAHSLGGRPVWLAMRIGTAELAPILAAHLQAQRRAHRLLLILVPEDPAMGPDWAKNLIADGQTTALRSAGEEPSAQTQVYVADTPGEAGLWYRLAEIAFLGQSLEPNGGLNPFEAAALGSAILHGPNVRAHQRAYDRLAAVGATRLVRDADTLGEMIEALLSPDVAAGMAHEGWRVCSAGAEVTDRLIDLILTTLDQRETA